MLQAKAPAAKTTATWTDGHLGSVLEDLGYEPKTIALTNGRKLYRIALTRDGWNFHIDAVMSNNQRVLWLTARLCKLPEPGKVRAEALERKLLKLNSPTRRRPISRFRTIAFWLCDCRCRLTI